MIQLSTVRDGPGLAAVAGLRARYGGSHPSSGGPLGSAAAYHFDHFDALPGTGCSLLLSHAGVPMATLRLTRDGPLGLPLDAHWCLESLRGHTDAPPLAAISCVAVHPRLRGDPDALDPLFNEAWGVLMAWGPRRIFAEVDPSHDTQELCARLKLTHTAESPLGLQLLGPSACPEVAPRPLPNVERRGRPGEARW